MKDNAKVKVKVIKKFIDKHTGKVHEPSKDGKFLAISKERLEEIKTVEEKLKIKLVEEVVEENTTKKGNKKDTE